MSSPKSFNICKAFGFMRSVWTIALRQTSKEEFLHDSADLGIWSDSCLLRAWGQVCTIAPSPPEGVTLPWGHFPQDSFGVSGLPEACRLHSKPKSMKWFTLGWFAFDKKARIDKMVDQLIAVYPEVEAWFATRAIGPHLSRFNFPLA
jgi:hypothetical protein